MSQTGRPAQIDWAFFDFDGTLSDTEALYIELDMPVYQSYGITPTKEELLSLAGTTGTESIPALFANYGLDVSAEEFFGKRGGNRPIYASMPLSLYDGARDVLDKLRANGTCLAVVSTTEREYIEIALQRLGIAELFEFLICGREAGECKPNPAPYLKALELAKTDVDHAIVLEDSPTGVSAARAAGLYTIAIKAGIAAQPTPGTNEEIASYTELKL